MLESTFASQERLQVKVIETHGDHNDIWRHGDEAVKIVAMALREMRR